jgi:hypothetical protein
VLFGGARGGGKTDGVLGKWAIKSDRYGRHFNAVFFRLEMPQQDDLIERAKEIYLPLGAQWNEQKKTVRFGNGARVRFRPLENVADAMKYQGQNLTDAAVEEAGNYASPGPIDRLHGALRSVAGVPTQMILTANPGGPGHHWIKSRYIDPAPNGMKILDRPLANGASHRYAYIPSRLRDNRILMQQDPSYVDRLHLVGSAELVRAWVDGDWNVIAGAFFPEFGPQHVVRPCELPREWLRFRVADWGSARPFAVGWWAVSDGSMQAFPRGALIQYREWYGMQPGQPNVGLRLPAEAWGRGIKERSGVEQYAYSTIDPAALAEDGGPSIAERSGILWDPADNKRVARHGAMGGWDQLRARLLGEEGRPALYFFDTCTESIRTLPAMQHDDDRIEDVDTSAEDHAPDMIRYACMSRPYIRAVPAPPEAPRGPRTYEEMIERAERRMSERARI